jgi:ERCC4-type nuclease
MTKSIARLSDRVSRRVGAVNVLVDSREPWPHAWQRDRYLPEGWALERGTLETGDFCLASHPEGAVVERKTPSDMAACVGASRERFERELRRGRYAGRLIVVIEGSLSDVCNGRP